MAVLSFFVIVAFATSLMKGSYTELIQSKNYVTGAYAKYCYVNGHVNSNIKKRLYYSNLSDCGKSLRK